ncbi:MAG: cofactor-independent phosphoglycerate mutase [Actinomycetota bacterium]|nr:cofactor-independent phosphoglycerate mutase [Actinomycetota bacterium]
MKYIIILIDGMADYRIAELGNRTPLQYAKTPAMDNIAGNSEMGTVRTIPEGMAPGSDVANLTVLGYDPGKYHAGRSPLEAASLGIDLSENDVVFRCNLITLSGEDNYADKVMLDHSAGDISTGESAILIEYIGSRIGTEKIKFYPGVSYRHIIVWEGGTGGNILTPPHDIPGKKISAFLPAGPDSGVLLDMMTKSGSLLNEHIINKKRIKRGLNPANSIWIWGEGKKIALDSFYEKYKLRGSIISAVDLLKGIGILAGLEPVEVKGATGTMQTNFGGKADAAINELRSGKDFVYLHLEATDECSHHGNTGDKVRSIEIIDSKVIGPIKEALDKQGTRYRMMILPDHYTPISVRTHTSEPVPFMIYDSTVRTDGRHRKFDEFSAKESGLYFQEGHRLADHFFKKES